ncbi:hypothetical protein CAEBREN_20427 [Caenorhabditis brenneri]|uniref:Uncharacterized protein n=1 Tax=Caenorhabditis brenneri TaxID=135651 RepID=G0NXL4_CAEBE|nr:hypothetical protein CAEBREN_20427 [Caenorhabditis brenneri]
MSGIGDHQQANATNNVTQILLNHQHPIMSGSQDHQQSSGSSNVIHTCRLVVTLYRRNEILTEERNAARALFEKSQDEIRGLKTQLRESEMLRTQSHNSFMLLFNSHLIVDEKLKLSENMVKNLETLLEMSKAKTRALENLEFKAFEDLKACKSQFEEFETQTQNTFHLLEKKSSEAHLQVLAQQARCLEAEAKTQAQEKELARCDEEFKALKSELHEAKTVAAREQVKVEIQLEQSQEEVRQLREETLVLVQNQLDRSQEKVISLEGVISELKKKLDEKEVQVVQAPRKRGRPPKAQTALNDAKKQEVQVVQAPRKRGRPSKAQTALNDAKKIKAN